LILISSPTANAFWGYRYFSGFSFQNEKWSSAAGTDSGGEVNIGQPGDYILRTTQYSATFSASNGVLLYYHYAPAGGWSGYGHQTTSNSFQQCWWNANANLPNAQPQTLCNQYRD
jgi:hypothetical protein